MSVFQAEKFCGGDGAKEAAYQAEGQYMAGDYDKKELAEILNEEDGFSEMYYKDDDGYYRITGNSKKFDDYEALSKYLGYQP